MKAVMPQLKGLADGNLVRQIAGRGTGRRLAGVTLAAARGTRTRDLRRIAASLCLLFGAVAAWLPAAAAAGAARWSSCRSTARSTTTWRTWSSARSPRRSAATRARSCWTSTARADWSRPPTEIRDALLGSPVPVDAYVSRAWSAGALVALSAGRIEMAPAASIGAAEPVPDTAATVAALRGEFAATAVRYRRDATLAAAMVDPAVDAPAYKAPGAILTLTADQARAAGISEATASSFDAALAPLELGRPPRARAPSTASASASRASRPTPRSAASCWRSGSWAC